MDREGRGGRREGERGFLVFCGAGEDRHIAACGIVRSGRRESEMEERDGWMRKIAALFVAVICV